MSIPVDISTNHFECWCNQEFPSHGNRLSTVYSFKGKFEMVSHIDSLEILIKAKNCTLQGCTDFFGNVPGIIHGYTIGLTPGTTPKK